MEKFRGWVRARPIIWVVGVFVVAGILGAAAGSSGESGLKDEKAELEDTVALAEEKREDAEAGAEDAEAEAAEVKDEEGKILDGARRQARKIVGEAKAEAEELENVEGEIASAESELADVEASLTGAEKEKSLSSFGGGIMKGEVDYTVGGTYEATGGEGCYWAMLNSANTSDISANEFTTSAGQQIVTIETPYFTSEDCGTWKRIE